VRIGYSEDEDYPGQFELWQANCRRSLKGRAGQSALRELEAALVALPEKRLIAHKLVSADGEVCAIGALARYKGRDLVAETRSQLAEIGIDHFDDEIEGGGEMEVTCEGPYRWPAEKPKTWVDITPESRYKRVLEWVRRQLQ
jgi:hypothetical protein